MSTSEPNTVVFSQGTGYGLVIGLGFAFAVIMLIVSKLLEKIFNEIQNSEMLMTAKRSISSTGLLASSIVSSWTIGSTLLLSTTSAYQNGVSSAYWYGAGACVQIIIFSCMALEMKRKAPNCHTYQEIVAVRYSTHTHLIAFGYSAIQMVTYTVNLLINGSSVFSNITGMNRDAAICLFPIGVIIYTLVGGIKATFLTDWTHTVIIFVILLTFMFNTYATNDTIGSPAKLWELLTATAERRPIEGNAEGSLMTLSSVQGGLFGLVLFGAGWAASVDSQLFQKAIAAAPEKVCLSYILGSLAWFTIPFCLATTLGLAAAGIETLSVFPTYPNLMSEAQIGDGLVMPYAAAALMGKGGVGAVLTMIFMAVTAAYSSETIAVSALVTHDIYKRYFDPNASGKKLVLVSHSVVIGFGIVTIGMGIGLAHAGFDVSFITTVSGIVVNVNVIPMMATLFWTKMSSFAYSVGTILSTCISLAVWFGYTVHQSGTINLTTLSTNEALAAGNTVAVGVPLIIVPILVWIKPANFDWETWKLGIKQDDNVEFDESHHSKQIVYNQEKSTQFELDKAEQMQDVIMRQRKYGFIATIVFVLFFLIVFPLPLYGSGYVFSKTFFRGWIVVMFIWGFVGAFIVILLPLWEARFTFMTLIKVMMGKKPQPRGDIRYKDADDVEHQSEDSSMQKTKDYGTTVEVVSQDL
ncbi:Sodium:solute symporter family-domain-containing protein [Scheffersomyces amazonensis]|uniref:Sodium:solute symporter family-domain-containing protein n=1 Tax=Scheffersomyces amazonensis TaxID=1078765 RepID=UPI00315D4647